MDTNSEREREGERTSLKGRTNAKQIEIYDIEIFTTSKSVRSWHARSYYSWSGERPLLRHQGPSHETSCSPKTAHSDK